MNGIIVSGIHCHMKKHRDTDKAVRNIMNWADRPEWSNELAALFDAHLAPVCERIGINKDDLGRELADHGYDGMLFGIMFEDFLTRRLPPDDRNIIDDYLAHRGWRESVPGRRYLRELRDSVLCLYEVIEVSTGQYCDLRDLVRGGKSFRVNEYLGTQNMVKWDRIAARVLNIEGKYCFSGGILPFPLEASQSLLRVLDNSQKQFNKGVTRAAEKLAISQLTATVDAGDLFLRETAHAFTSLWLVHTLERLHAPLPEIINRDGEALMLTETRFPFPVEQSKEIARRLDAAPEWERDNPNEHNWSWLPESETGNNPHRGMITESFQGGQRLISGTLRLAPGTLTLTTNSMERTERGKTVLEALLHGLIGPPLSKLQTPEQLLAESTSRARDDPGQSPDDSIDPEVAAQVIHTMLDQHYRQSLDEPIPLLGNKTPRQCAKSKKGREKVIDWLKHLENNELRRAAQEGQKPYDSNWMWEELKLDQFRD